MAKCQNPVVAMASMNGGIEKPVCKQHLKKAQAFADTFSDVKLQVKHLNNHNSNLSCCEEE